MRFIFLHLSIFLLCFSIIIYLAQFTSLFLCGAVHIAVSSICRIKKVYYCNNALELLQLFPDVPISCTFFLRYISYICASCSERI